MKSNSDPHRPVVRGSGKVKKDWRSIELECAAQFHSGMSHVWILESAVAESQSSKLQRI